MTVHEAAHGGADGIAVLLLQAGEDGVGLVDGEDAVVVAVAAVGGTADPVEGVGAVGEAGTALGDEGVGMLAALGEGGGEGVATGDVEAHEIASVGVGPRLVADDIAHGPGDEMAAVGTELEGLGHMGMASDDMVDAVVDEPLGEGALLSGGQLLILDAPVGQGDDGIGLHLARLGDVGTQLKGVDEVDDVGMLDGQSVGAVGEVEQGYAQPIALEEEGIGEVARLLVDIGAEMGHVEGVHHEDGALEACAMAVDAVVVGCEEDVEAGIDDGLQVLVGRTELGIAGVGLAAEGDLEVGDGDVGTLHLRAYACEALVVVVRSVALECCLDLRPMLHEVASEEEAEVMVVWGDDGGVGRSGGLPASGTAGVGGEDEQGRC